jgi:hypothetical protein
MNEKTRTDKEKDAREKEYECGVVDECADEEGKKKMKESLTGRRRKK